MKIVPFASSVAPMCQVSSPSKMETYTMSSEEDNNDKESNDLITMIIKIR